MVGAYDVSAGTFGTGPDERGHMRQARTCGGCEAVSASMYMSAGTFGMIGCTKQGYVVVGQSRSKATGDYGGYLRLPRTIRGDTEAYRRLLKSTGDYRRLSETIGDYPRL